MPIFQTVQNFAPEISLQYNEEKELYEGRLISRTGVYEFEGPDKNSVMYSIDGTLRREYNELLRSLEVEQSAGLSLGGGSRQQGEDVGRNQGIMSIFSHFGLGGLSDLCLGGWNALTGSPHKYKVLFAGAVVSAPTRGMLRKKLAFQQNRRIHKIMMGVRIEKKDKDLVAHKKAELAARKIQIKRKKAMAQQPGSWEKRVQSERERFSIEEKVSELRSQISDKKQYARDLWTGR